MLSGKRVKLTEPGSYRPTQELLQSLVPLEERAAQRWIGPDVPPSASRYPYDTYIIGSLRSPLVPEVHRKLQLAGLRPFSDWYSAGPEADDHWKAHAKAQGLTYEQALKAPHAQNVFQFDRAHLLASRTALQIAPAGRSGWGELMWMSGLGRPAYMWLSEPAEDPERWDVMALFATEVSSDLDHLIARIKEDTHRNF